MKLWKRQVTKMDCETEYQMIVALREISNVEARIECAHESLTQALNNIQTNRCGACKYPVPADYDQTLKTAIEATTKARDEYLKLIVEMKRHFVSAFELSDVIVDEIPDRTSSDLITDITGKMMECLTPLMPKNE